MRLDFLRRILPRQYEDQAFLDACAEIFKLQQQAKRLKDAMELEIREHCADKRQWQHQERVLIDINHDLAAQLASAHGQLIANGIEV